LWAIWRGTTRMWLPWAIEAKQQSKWLCSQSLSHEVFTQILRGLSAAKVTRPGKFRSSYTQHMLAPQSPCNWSEEAGLWQNKVRPRASHRREGCWSRHRGRRGGRPPILCPKSRNKPNSSIKPFHSTCFISFEPPSYLNPRLELRREFNNIVYRGIPRIKLGTSRNQRITKE